jgi:hypothetical protein
LNLRGVKVTLIILWALGYLPLGFAHSALAAGCSMRIENFKDKNVTKVTFSHGGCTLGEIIEFSKNQKIVSTRVFDDILNRSLRSPTIGTTPCEIPGCRPCQGGLGGKCEIGDKLPDSLFVISVSSQASKRPRTQGPVISPTSPLPSTAPTNAEEKSFLSKYGVTQYTPSREQPSVSLVLYDQGANTFDSKWVDQISQAGYLIAALSTSTGAFEMPGKSMGKAYDVLIRGINDRDPVLERSLAERKVILQSILQEATESVTSAAAELTQASEEIRIAFKVHASQIDAEFASTTRDIAQLRSRAQSTEEAVRDLSIIITSQKSRAQKNAEQTTADLNRLRQSLLTDDAINQSKSRIIRSLQEQSPSEVAAFISGIQGQMANSTNPALREQYENILRTVTDQRGLVTSAAIVVGLPNDLRLETEETSSVGRAVRQNLNEALLVYTRGSAKVDLAYAVKAVFLADQAFAKQNNNLGNRYLNRARSLLDFATGHQRVETYRKLPQNGVAIERFGTLPPVTSYASYQTRKTSNALAEVPIEAFSDETFILSNAAMRQMVELQNNAAYLERFHQALDVADTVLDFAKGVGSGMLTAGAETATGLIDAVVHPIDTAKGFAQAVFHLDLLFDAAVRSAAKVIEEYPEYPTEKKGEVVGEISFHVASAWFSMGMGKAGATAADLARAGRVESLAQSLEKAVSSTKNFGIITGEEVKKFVSDLASPKRANHILHGDATGGGHMFPGKSGKTIFPESWSANKILHEVSDVVSDPSVRWESNRTVRGLDRFKARGVRDGVEIEVIIEPKGEGIISAWPVSGPGVITNPS